MKKFLILCFVSLAAVSCVQISEGQTPAKEKQNPPSKTQLPSVVLPTPPAPLISVPLDLVFARKMRDTQYQQDKEIIKHKQLEIEEAASQKKIDDLQSTIRQAAFDAAQAQKIDITKYTLDLDQLVWVPLQIPGKQGDVK